MIRRERIWCRLTKWLLCLLAIWVLFPKTAMACYYDGQTDTVYCQEPGGCGDPHLLTAKKIVIRRLKDEGKLLLAKNQNAVSVEISDLSNLNEYDRSRLYRVLSRNDLSTAAILFAYENPRDSVGNDGTVLYQRKLEQFCPQIEYLRSCATVVSVALCASGLGDCKSAGTDALVSYLEKSPNWKRMGALRKNKMEPGDIVFIDRKSHAAAYQSGAMQDSEFEADIEEEEEYHGGYDSTGHRNYETQDPTGSVSEVFDPDQDGDGRVNDWEAEYWRCYWQRVNGCDGYVPPYDYYATWLEAARVAAAEKERIREERRIAMEKRKKKIIHDHIFVWTGNETIKKFYPESKADIVSGSYTENYKKARSAALGTYNFKGDYRVYRYVGELPAK